MSGEDQGGASWVGGEMMEWDRTRRDEEGGANWWWRRSERDEGGLGANWWSGVDEVGDGREEGEIGWGGEVG